MGLYYFCTMPPGIQEMDREELISIISSLYDENQNLQFENGNLKKAIFGSKSERFVPEVAPEQTSLDFGDTGISAICTELSMR